MQIKGSAEIMFGKQEKCRAGNQLSKIVCWEVELTDKEENEPMAHITFFGSFV